MNKCGVSGLVLFSVMSLLLSPCLTQPNFLGQTGLFRVSSAENPPKWNTAVSLRSEYMSQEDFLLLDNELKRVNC